MKLEYKKDKFGKEGLFSVDGKHQIMMEWEKDYMKACIDKLQPYGDVLEIGFGMGYSADRIQSYNVKTHTIIECNPVVLERLEKYKLLHPNVNIVKGRWQDVLQNCDKFDVIFFDDYISEDKDDSNRFIIFLNQVLKNHSKRNTRISVYSTCGRAAYENLPGISVESEEFIVDIPEYCNYAKGNKMYTLVITKIKNLKDKLIEMIYDPYNPIKNYELALEYKKLDQTAIALSYFLRCAEFTNDNILASECLIGASLCINKQENRDEKELYLIKHAISCSPNSIEPYYIASLYFSWRSGEKPEKRLWLDSYLYASMGINILENKLETRNFKMDVGYKKTDIYFQKACAGSNIGKIDEAREIYTNILSTFEISDTVRNYIVKKKQELPEPCHPIIPYSNTKINKLKFYFNNYDNIDKNYSQVYQDMFVLSMYYGKKEGTYLEIGSGDYKSGNNTYLLEQKFNWSGISIDINELQVKTFNNIRKNKCLCLDATKINYLNLLTENYKSTNIDYLQLDCDPPNITYEILSKIPFDKYKFGVITYEHDFYNDSTGKYREKSRELLKEKGYKLIAGNISSYRNSCPFEDWWIHPELIEKHIYSYFERNDDLPINGEAYMLRDFSQKIYHNVNNTPNLIHNKFMELQNILERI